MLGLHSDRLIENRPMIIIFVGGVLYSPLIATWHIISNSITMIIWVVLITVAVISRGHEENEGIMIFIHSRVSTKSRASCMNNRVLQAAAKTSRPLPMAYQICSAVGFLDLSKSN